MPAFGLPISPTSAMTLSSNRSSRFSPSPPGVESRGAIRRTFEVARFLSRRTAASGNNALAVVHQVLDDKLAFGINDERSGRHFNDQIFGTSPCLFAAAARCAACGAPKAMVRQRGQIVHAIFGDDDHAAAIAAVAAVGTAVRDIFCAKLTQPLPPRPP